MKLVKINSCKGLIVSLTYSPSTYIFDQGCICNFQEKTQMFLSGAKV